ncbi:IS110 family transposase [Alkalihalobacterium bogoriense]|uniref:IS110 family transposase n=1 Tax=Alkalihalobacterium bogoriense TaxID=246272 RepID=UPI000478955F|nr:IS110 family transposase [Alkalihalobacterium bogoriense]
MNDNTKYVGLDVSKENIAVAIAYPGREKPWYRGEIPNTPEAIRKLMKTLGNPEDLKVCYEAGPTGYPIYRFLLTLGIECEVIAPGLIPQRPGDRVKTDKRDAIRLAQLFRAGELTSIYIPTKEDEALRDLVRAREDAKEDELRVKHRITKLLLRYNIRPPEGVGRNWSSKYREWIHTLKFEYSTLRIAFQEYLQNLQEVEQRLKRLEAEIEVQATEGVHAPMIQALQCLRGVATITATSLVAEIGSFKRFRSPKQLMAYTGLIPSESSSGGIRKQGSLTKTGNTHVRRLLVESAWSYRYQPAVRDRLKKRQDGQPGSVQSISWKAQQRLHKKFFRLLSRGKSSKTAIAAVARELAGFIWAIAQEIEGTPKIS